MNTVLESRIRDRILAYLAGEISLDELDQWVTENAWDPAAEGDLAAADLVASFNLLVAEFDNKEWTTEQFRHRLQTLANTYTTGRPSYSTAVAPQNTHRVSLSESGSLEMVGTRP